MNKAKRNYKSKCKKREVDFYIKDIDLYETSKIINFSKFVKNCLRNKTQIDKMFNENDTVKEGEQNGKNGDI